MKLVTKPVLECTSVEYKTEIEPVIKMLDDIDVCPCHNEPRNTTWNCDEFDDCCLCPFGQANDKVREAMLILKNIQVVS